MGDSVEEFQRLQACINDLVTLLALPVLWSGHDTIQKVGIFLDVLMRMLRLDFAYARLRDSDGGPWLEAVRIAADQRRLPQPRELERALEPWLDVDSGAAGLVMANPLGEGEVSVSRSSLGDDNDLGVVLTGSQRRDFPSEIEKLLTRVAINQCVIELQRAQVAAARQRAAEIERSRNQLDAENAHLRQEMAGTGESTLRGIERDHILRVLHQCNWVVSGPSGAATKLGLKRTSLQYKMQRLGIVRPRKAG